MNPGRLRYGLSFAALAAALVLAASTCFGEDQVLVEAPAPPCPAALADLERADRAVLRLVAEIDALPADQREKWVAAGVVAKLEQAGQDIHTAADDGAAAPVSVCDATAALTEVAQSGWIGPHTPEADAMVDALAALSDTGWPCPGAD